MKFGFIGSGKMASALVHGVTQSGAVPRDCVLVTDIYAAAAQKLATEAGVTALPTNADVVAAADTLVICVKPNDALAALRDLNTSGKLVISIVAGLQLADLQKAAGQGTRIIRVMPNTPALVHEGAAGYALGEGATADDGKIADLLFGAVGKVVAVKESLIDVVTGLSGSGPAYIYLVIEAMADGAVLMGLPRDLALRLAAQTVLGSAKMVLETGLHPAVLRDQVTSPGGTTIAAVEALENGGARAAFIAAVRVATERARELGDTK